MFNNNIRIRPQPIAFNQRRIQPMSKKIPTCAWWFCGDWHYSHSCPYKNHKCQLCLKRGYKKNCFRLSEAKFSDSSSKWAQRKSVNKSYHKRNELRFCRHSISSIFKIESKSHRKCITRSVNKIRVRFDTPFDTASDITLISRSTNEWLGKPDLSGEEIRLSCAMNYSIHFSEKSFSGTCYITESCLNSIGLDWRVVLDFFLAPINICSFFSVRDLKQLSSFSQNEV